MPQNQAYQPSGWPSKIGSWKILFVSGKGGVGKSLVSAALAADQARAGRRVLLVEIGDNSYYKDFFGLPKVGHEPVRLKQGFDVAMWSGDTCLREYVLHYLKLQRLYGLFFENKVMRALVNVAPGLNEIAILGKITSGIRKVGPVLDYDLIVVDCYATGHALALLEAPRGMMEAISFGPMGHHSREMEAVISNPELCGYLAVTLLEEMPVVETLEFRTALKRVVGIECEVIANKVLELPVEREKLRPLAEARGLGEFAKYLGAIADRQKEMLEVLKKSISRFVQVPLIFSNDPDQLVERTAEALKS